MTFRQGAEEYYQKFIELQEKLRSSEEERLKLELKFNEMVQVTRDEEQMYFRRLRTQYKAFLEENSRRQERNERILRLMERIESRAAILEAKTRRIQLLRTQYRAIMDRISKGETRKPRIEPKDDYKEDILKKYLEMQKKVQTTQIADKIMQSIQSRKLAKDQFCHPDSHNANHLPAYPQLSKHHDLSHLNYNCSFPDRSQVFANDNPTDLTDKWLPNGEFKHYVQQSNDKSQDMQHNIDHGKSFPDIQRMDGIEGDKPFKDMQQLYDGSTFKDTKQLNNPSDGKSFEDMQQLHDDTQQLSKPEHGMSFQKFNNGPTYKDIRQPESPEDGKSVQELNVVEKSHKDTRNVEILNQYSNDNVDGFSAKRQIQNSQLRESNEIANDKGKDSTVLSREPECVNEIMGSIPNMGEDSAPQASDLENKQMCQENVEQDCINVRNKRDLPALDSITCQENSSEVHNPSTSDDQCKSESINEQQQVMYVGNRNGVKEDSIIEKVTNLNEGVDRMKDDSIENQQGISSIEESNDDFIINQGGEESIENNGNQEENAIVQIKDVSNENQSENTGNENEGDNANVAEFKDDFSGNGLDIKDDSIDNQTNGLINGSSIERQRDKTTNEISIGNRGEESANGISIETHGDGLSNDLPISDRGEGSINANSIGKQGDVKESINDNSIEHLRDVNDQGSIDEASNGNQIGNEVLKDVDDQGAMGNPEGINQQGDLVDQEAGLVYDENGQSMMYDESGNAYQYDESQLGYDGNYDGSQMGYDENGQPIQYDENAYYDENGQPIYYDENGQPIQYDATLQYDENGQPIQQDYGYEQQEEFGGSQVVYGQEEEEKKSANVMDLLETDSESARQETKASNDSDFDFSNNA